MGIKGIYNEIGPGDRIALSKLAVEFFEKKGRPLRLAIDISIWLFQIQAGEGGTNPALRTFYYRLLRLIALSIHPVFVFDGPNKPPFKRHKRTMAPGVKTVSIPEFLAKQLLKHFALPMHLAPGEAEAECALLQRLGYVDAVLSEDADTLMFGSGLTLRNLSPEGSLKTKVATHVNVYVAQKVKDTAGLDREGMILVALMSGGDYIPEGIPGCGPKIACQAARAGFGRDLCNVERDHHAGLAAWKERLIHELHTNESKFFSRKHPALKIADDFPRRDILRFYTHPCTSSVQALKEQLPQKLQWDREIDIPALRTFTGDAFEWFYISGAKKFIRNLAPALLVKALRLRDTGAGIAPDSPSELEQQESQLIKSIHLKRNHVSTDRASELRVGFTPIDLVPLDLNSETPDPQTMDDVDLDEEENIALEGNEEPTSPKKKRGPSTYDPTRLEKIWLLESFVRIGVPLKVQDWEESLRNLQKAKETRLARDQVCKSPRKPARSDMPRFALERFTKVTKPGVNHAKQDEEPQVHKLGATEISLDTNSERPVTPRAGLGSPIPSRPTFRAPLPLAATPSKTSNSTLINLISSPDPFSQVCRHRRSKSHTPAPEPVVQADSTQPVEFSIPKPNNLDTSSEVHPSVTARRPRPHLRRAQTAAILSFSNESVKASAAPRSSQDSVAKCLNIPQSLLRSNDTVQPSSPAFQSSKLPLRPSTPSPKKDSRQRFETINLCSSPSTPKYRQRSITEWASPQKSPVAVSKATRISAENRETEDPLLRNRSDDGKRERKTATRVQPLSEMSDGNLNTSIPLQPRFQKPTRLPTFSAIGKDTGDFIRLRESVDGAWRVEEGSSTSRSPPYGHDEKDALARKRKRTQWRVSQVQTLDLTGV